MGRRDFQSVSEDFEVVIFGNLKMLPTLEAFGAQETNNAGIPSFLGNIGCFQHKGDMTATPEMLSAGPQRGQWNVGGWNMSCPAIVLEID